MNKVVAEELAAKIGRLVQTDSIGYGLMLNKSFFRFRVDLNIRESFARVYFKKRKHV